MNYQLTNTPSLTSSQCLVLGVFSDSPLTDCSLALDTQLNGLIDKLSKKTVEVGDSVWQSDINNGSLLIVQLGKEADYNVKILQKRLTEINSALNKQRINTATICLPQLPCHSPNWQLEQMLMHIDNCQYQLLDYKKKHKKPYALESVTFYLPKADEETLKTAEAIAEGITLTRTLANLPANVCTPTYLANEAIKLSEQLDNLSCQVMEPKQIQEMGMNALLSIAQGSSEPARFIELHYQGNKTSAPIVLVGKGITFDSGGLSIKPGNAMGEMKYDMCGAASVLGTLNACAKLKLPVNVIGLIPSAENMVNGAAVKPGDIVTSMSGQTIEIINTDAEGRVLLADALTYAERFNPEFVIDIATLTGAIIVALGSVASGFMTKDDQLAQKIEEAAVESGDRVWRMPLDEEYQESINSPLADMLNSDFDRTASSITAACFLSRFTEKYRWAHLDIAGTAWVSGKNRNATGRPVPLLVQLIRHAANLR